MATKTSPPTTGFHMPGGAFGYIGVGAVLIVLGNTKLGPFVALSLVAVLAYWLVTKG